MMIYYYGWKTLNNTMHQRISKINIEGFGGSAQKSILELASKSLLCYGPSASGKSTIVNAIEMCLTGGVSLPPGPQNKLTDLNDLASLFIQNGDTNISVCFDDHTDFSAIQHGNMLADDFVLRGTVLRDLFLMSRSSRADYLEAALNLQDLVSVVTVFTQALNKVNLVITAYHREAGQYQHHIEELLESKVSLDKSQAVTAINDLLTKISVDAVLDMAAKAYTDILNKIATVLGREKYVVSDLVGWEKSVSSNVKAGIGLHKKAKEICDLVRGKQDILVKYDLYEKALRLIGEDSRSTTVPCPVCAKDNNREELVNLLESKIEQCKEAKNALARLVEEFEAIMRDELQLYSPSSIYKEVALKNEQVKPVYELLEAESRRLSGWVRTCQTYVHSMDELPAVLPELPTEYESSSQWSKTGAQLDALVKRYGIVGDFEKEAEKSKILVETYSKWVRVEQKAEQKEQQAKILTRLKEISESHKLKVANQILAHIASEASKIYCRLRSSAGFDDIAITYGSSSRSTSAKGSVELKLSRYGTSLEYLERILSESEMNAFSISLFLGRVLSNKDGSSFIIFDDIASGMDRDHQSQLAELVVELSRDRQIIVLAHDADFYNKCEIAIKELNLKKGWLQVRLGPLDPRSSLTLEHGLRERIRSAGQPSLYASQVRMRVQSELAEICGRAGARVLYSYPAMDPLDLQAAFGGMTDLKERIEPPELAGQVGEVIKFLRARLKLDLDPASHDEAHDVSSSEDLLAILDRLEELRTILTCKSCKKVIWANSSNMDGGRSRRCDCGELTIKNYLQAPVLSKQISTETSQQEKS